LVFHLVIFLFLGKVATSAVSLLPRNKLDENTAAAIAVVSQSSRGRSASGCMPSWRLWSRWTSTCGMFDQRTKQTSVVYVISDEPMSDEE
jgi:hypothetical protein